MYQHLNVRTGDASTDFQLLTDDKFEGKLNRT